ncbi:protein-glutamine gamma-glutamyltransferase K-like [Ptychodera flava]|uniref:protein-glutamine gamma-glutamyltransferase K-like n=1 Tax=Ptychodera flava TaxID=63121 RepID=UPI00396A09F5
MPRPRRVRTASEDRHRRKPYSYETSTPGRRVVSTEEFNFPPPPETEKQLKVTGVDLQKLQNSKEHHTDEYELEELVVRRGQPINLTIYLNQEYNADDHAIELELRVENYSGINYGTRVPIPQVNSTQEDDWGIHVIKSDGNKVECVMYTAADCLVAKYKLYVETYTKGEDEFRFECPDEFCMIFNPWCKADDVYMEDDVKRREYVMSETNLYYFGTARTIGWSHWYQGQFEEVVLKCVFQLLDESGMAKRNLGSPIHVVRALSAMLNSEDDDGVLVGNWSGDYSDGVEPTEWTGSVAIFEEYMKTGKPVCYGQCWVFAGIFTTAMRALGIPCRTLTNFESAHDTDGNLTLDYHYNEEGDPIEDLNEDSVWNFHVWNDCWMARPDLPEGYGGWQAVDATPQETSEGIFRTGPSPLTAIKRGDVHLGYDTKFVFAEVNAERVDWIMKKDSKQQVPADVDPSSVGKRISTKKLAMWERDDITDDYKFAEGSERERIAVITASKHVKSAKKVYKDIKKDVQFEVDVSDEVMVGKDVEVEVKITNDHMTDAREIFVSLTCNSVRYTGVKVHQVLVKKENVKVGPGESTSHKVVVSVTDYKDKLTEHAALKFFVMCGVKGTGQTFVGHYDFRFRKPELTITIEPSGPLRKGDPFKATAMFSNPLPITLQFCSFRLEGTGIEGQIKKTIRNVPAGKDAELEVKLTPKRVGKSTLIASFHSSQLSGVTGSIDLEIIDPAAEGDDDDDKDVKE